MTRMLTAKNRVEARKNQIMRERTAREKASAVTRAVKPAALPRVAWAEQAPRPSERAKHAGRKADQLARHKAALAAERRARKRREDESTIAEAERLRNLAIADSILYD